MSGIVRLCTYWKQSACLLIALFSCVFTYSQNPIVIENALPGNPTTDWEVSGAGDLSIQGFATDISVNKGDTVKFKINTDASGYLCNIYRLGWYNGDGARLWGTGTITATLPQTQPPPITDLETGLVDCGNWAVSAYWKVPANAVSGVYIAKLTRTDSWSSSHIIFIVRDDASTSDLLFQTSDATWQAYNNYGGNSLYLGSTSYPSGHAVKVSYNRPFLTRAGGGGGGSMEDWVFNAEYPMIRFLERNGYNVTYFTNVDAARRGNLIANHKVFLSVGHDEYWSKEQRDNVEAARNAGVHLAFFSGNEVYWKTRWENSVDGSGTSHRTLVCYKEGTEGERVCGTKCDPSTEWTGLWRSGCAYPSANGCKPENSLTGQISWQHSTTSIQVPSTYKSLRFWRNTPVASTPGGTSFTLPNGTLGYEWDDSRYDQFGSSYPGGRIILSSTTVSGRTHNLSLYRHSSGALVFGAGTVQWSWGLDDEHDRGNEPASPSMQQATVNLFADMGVQPGSLQSGLVAATQSTDSQPPTVTIISPSHNASFKAFSPVTLVGSAFDTRVLAGIEVSTDGGLTWKLANGTSNWSFTFTPQAVGTINVRVRGFDDSGNLSNPGAPPTSNSISLNITDPTCPCTLYNVTDAPDVTNVYDGATGIELGVKFRPLMNGYITGMRFYKSTNDVGTHVGTLWSLTGTELARATFINESLSGWQEVVFDVPVAVTANTTYVASYHSPTGYYAETNPYFTTAVINGPLMGIAKTDPDGPNGVYEFSSTPTFPDDNYASNNYWVDVVFNTTADDTEPPFITATSPVDYSININTNSSFSFTFNESIDPITLNGSTVELRNSLNQVVPSTVSYNSGTHTLTVTPVSNLNYSSVYTVKLKGESSGSGIMDLSGNELAADATYTFNTKDETTIGMNDGPGGPILAVYSAANPFGKYTAELLRAEGMNEFATAEAGTLNAGMLNNYDVIILGEMTVDAALVTMLTNWVQAGGTLIAFKPHALLNPLLGINAASGSLSDKYLLINTASGPGAGIVNQTIQFHGSANLHTLNGATILATLYSDATTATANPAVTSINVGPNGGKAIAFTFDLNKSIIYTRQGNPAWAGQKRDGTSGPIRSDDLFFGLPANTGADWIDFNKIAIPQADEQQRFLANIIIQSSLHRKPLPRFWYLPRDLKAAIVMTGDDHGVNGTAGRFNQYLTLGPNSPADVANWNAVRGTSYIYPGTPISNNELNSFQEQGFEFALHPTTNCTNFTQTSLQNAISSQLTSLNNQFPNLLPVVTNRTHCLLWSDWATQPKVEFNNGIRFDVNYYYWPGTWVQNRPGMFTGSGMPMRFADLDGSMIDAYQGATQITDESQIGVGTHTDALLDKALGPEGYYGVFTTNMHTDTANHVGSNAVIASAQARQVPVISARQMLTWIDSRNNSSFGNMTWNGSVLNFTITAASGSKNLRAMLPYSNGTSLLTQITRSGTPISFTVSTIKGLQYAVFNAEITGNYAATYGSPTTATLTGQVSLEGRGSAPNAQWVVPVVVELYVTGNPIPVGSYNTTTNTSGQFVVSGIPAGTYNIKVKNVHTLARVKLSQSLAAGNNNINFGLLLEGDANNDNAVDLLDFSILLTTYNKVIGEPGYDARADFNGDDAVDLLDFSLMLPNYNVAGEENP